MSITLVAALLALGTILFAFGFMLACVFINAAQAHRSDREWEAAGDFPNVPRRERIFHSSLSTQKGQRDHV